MRRDDEVDSCTIVVLDHSMKVVRTGATPFEGYATTRQPVESRITIVVPLYRSPPTLKHSPHLNTRRKKRRWRRADDAKRGGGGADTWGGAWEGLAAGADGARAARAEENDANVKIFEIFAIKKL